jgi:hypothetical protein
MEDVMVGLVKIAGVSAILAGLVTAFQPQGSATKRLDRLEAEGGAAQLRPAPAVLITGDKGAATAGRKGDFQRPAPGCAAQVWPNISPECLISADGTPIRLATRTVTVETREGANTSVLARLPVLELAKR